MRPPPFSFERGCPSPRPGGVPTRARALPPPARARLGGPSELPPPAEWVAIGDVEPAELERLAMSALPTELLRLRLSFLGFRFTLPPRCFPQLWRLVASEGTKVSFDPLLQPTARDPEVHARSPLLIKDVDGAPDPFLGVPLHIPPSLFNAHTPLHERFNNTVRRVRRDLADVLKRERQTVLRAEPVHAPIPLPT